MRKVVGEHTLVWHGGWSGAVQFPHLYAKSKNEKFLTVAQVRNNGNIKVPLTRGANKLSREEKQSY